MTEKDKKKRKPVVGTAVHYVDKHGSCKAAIVSGSFLGAVYLTILPRSVWQKKVTVKEGVSYSKKPLHYTWHYMDEHK